MELSKMIKIMTHYLNGGKIEIKSKNSNDWYELFTPSWYWDTFDYRIKEQKQKVTIEKWLIKDVNSNEHRIIESSNVDKYKRYEKVKLIESYEVELQNGTNK